MKASDRVIVNTIAQYIRIIVNMVLSLYTVRLVLQTLGENDFGIYSLIAGVVAMLAFVTNSLVATTQRFVSYYQGKGNIEKTKEIFNNSLFVHLILGFVIAVILELFTPFLFDGFLNIPEERIETGKLVYQTVVAIVFVSFITAPYRALLISHENIVYISIVDILDAVLKVILVITMTFLKQDKLILYSFIMLLINIVTFLLFVFYDYLKYVECVKPRFRRIKMCYIIEMGTFAGWSIYQTGCVVGRQQGIAILLNRLLGPVVNAAYGIGFQIAGYTNYLAGAIANAISPQIVKAEGAGERAKALWLSNVACKFNFYLLSALCIPCMFEINNILELWLGNVPKDANTFSIMVMLTLLCDAISVGLKYLVQAMGKLGSYSVITATPKLLTLPIAIILVRNNYPLEGIVIAYVIVELICSLLRIPYLHKRGGLLIRDFYKDVMLKDFLVSVALVFVCWLITTFIDFKYRFLLTFGFGLLFHFLTIYLIGLSSKEKEIIKNTFKSVFAKFK